MCCCCLFEIVQSLWSTLAHLWTICTRSQDNSPPPSVDSLFLITSDVEGLYANIQQDEALATVGGHLKRMAQGGQSNPALCAEVSRFAMNFVFRNAYMRHGDDAYKQLNGIPMSSPLSPPFANALVALHEDLKGQWEHKFDSLGLHLPVPDCMRMFRRLMDDYTIILSDVQRHHVDALLQVIKPQVGIGRAQGRVGCVTDLLRHSGPDCLQAT